MSTNGSAFSSAPVQIEVGNKDVNGVAIQIAGRSDLNGRVVPGDAGARIPLAPPNASLAQSPQIHFEELKGSLMSTAVVAADGSFHITSIAPGQYHVRLGWGAYVERMRSGAAETEGSMLDLRNGVGSEPLTITASSATAQVSGVVRNAPGSATSASTPPFRSDFGLDAWRESNRRSVLVGAELGCGSGRR